MFPGSLLNKQPPPPPQSPKERGGSLALKVHNIMVPMKNFPCLPCGCSRKVRYGSSDIVLLGGVSFW